MVIYCTGCSKKVDARLTDGTELYPHRPDLATLPFWVCDACKAFVGTHHKTRNHTHPLGVLATPELKRWRMIIHAALDPLWKSGKIGRSQAYAFVSDRLGHEYHTGGVQSVAEAKRIYEIVKELKSQLDPGPWNK